jgi:hypothetical protein
MRRISSGRTALPCMGICCSEDLISSWMTFPQVLGSLLMTEDLSPEDILLVGKDGLLLAGPNAGSFEP